MNAMIIKIGEFFGFFKKTQTFLKGKKTILSSIGGMLTSGGIIVGNVVRWANGEIDAAQCWNECQVPAAAFWASVTFLWSAFHADNVSRKDVHTKLGPGY